LVCGVFNHSAKLAPSDWAPPQIKRANRGKKIPRSPGPHFQRTRNCRNYRELGEGPLASLAAALKRTLVKKGNPHHHHYLRSLPEEHAHGTPLSEGGGGGGGGAGPWTTCPLLRPYMIFDLSGPSWSRIHHIRCQCLGFRVASGGKKLLDRSKNDLHSPPVAQSSRLCRSQWSTLSERGDHRQTYASSGVFNAPQERIQSCPRVFCQEVFPICLQIDSRSGWHRPLKGKAKQRRGHVWLLRGSTLFQVPFRHSHCPTCATCIVEPPKKTLTLFGVASDPGCNWRIIGSCPSIASVFPRSQKFSNSSSASTASMNRFKTHNR